MNKEIEWEDLGNAIIKQAHEDYLEALLLDHKAELMKNRAARLKRDVLSFYGSEYYYSLTNVSPDILIETAKKQRDYIIWQNNHGCKTCIHKDCQHKSPRANWKAFSDGARDCIKEADRRQMKKQKAEAKDD